ncbi:MAG: lipopolysaccharide export system permease protein [Oleiphilaceae bacterium]|jgi:lipopolysaccharide export system permease protein
MRRIDRYIVSNVAAAMMLVMAIVLSLDFMFAFIGEMDSLKGNYQIFEAFLYVVTTLPRRIYDYLPLAAFMGCLVGLGAMAKNSELVVLRAAGVSTGRIVFSTMKPALVIVLLSFLIGEYVAPLTERIAQSQKAIQRGASENVVVQSGLWHREGQVFMHFNAVEPNGVLHGVSMQFYDDKKELVMSRFAARAIYQRESWQLEQVVETHFLKDQIISKNYSSMEWKTELSPSLLSVLILKPDDLSITGLYTYSQYLKEQDLNASEYMMAFWKKILQPLTTGVLVLVAISFVFGPLRSVTMGFRVFSGVIVGLLFKYAQDLLGPSSLVFGFNPIYATLIPVTICFLVGIFLLRRAR